ncbi:MAG: hypothetical protein EPN23_04625 [Verrucomicrobia bacterium]|nr:MAG: hypothetical protein EPN23_04625 [Verrucomicrobiota bacterium]
MKTGRTHKFCFAAAPYANSAPLAHFLATVSPETRVVQDYHPSQMLQQLHSHSVDVALLPVAELLLHPELTMIEGLGVCARARVRSVLLKCKRPLEQVRTVTLDAASKTSNALTRVLFSKHWKMAVEMVPHAEHATADAAVVIGDRALCAPPAPHRDYDLAEQWNQMTGLPFVFAVWALRRDHPEPQNLTRIARAAHQAGMAALPELARLQAAKLGLSEALCQEYFRDCVHYDVGAQEQQALKLFQQLIQESAAMPAERGVLL